MSYHKRYSRLRPAQAMGDVASIIGTVLDVASDPYLPEVTCRIAQLKNIDHNEPVQECTETAPGVVGGVGLANAIPVLRAYVYAQQNKWVYPLAVLAILGLPFWAGYEVGRGSK